MSGVDASDQEPTLAARDAAKLVCLPRSTFSCFGQLGSPLHGAAVSCH